jgi:toxin ParE1/3/4
LRRTVRKSRLAETDLIGIWQYSFEQWDGAQADRYLDELDEAIRLLIDNPELGANRDFVRRGYRALFVKRHAIYYTATDAEIYVVRVLHEQMDPARHL